MKNLIKSIAKDALIETGLQIGLDTAYSISEKMHEKSGTTDRELPLRNPQNNHLWLNQYDSGEYLIRSSFNYSFFDDNGVMQYYAVGDKNNKLQKIKLYDKNKHLLGEIHEKRDLLKNPLDFKSHYDFTVIINKKKIGQINVTVSMKAKRISLNKNEWYTELKRSFKSQFSLPCYRIFSKDGKLIAETTEKMSGIFLDFSYEIDPVKLMLFMLAENAVYIIQSRKEGHYKLF